MGVGSTIQSDNTRSYFRTFSIYFKYFSNFYFVYHIIVLSKIKCLSGVCQYVYIGPEKPLYFVNSMKTIFNSMEFEQLQDMRFLFVKFVEK